MLYNYIYKKSNLSIQMQTNTSTSHPKGLYVLFATEMWERFSYYGMRAILVLFMIKALMFDKVFASNLYGSYTGLVYLTPLIGGYIADRYWGNRKSILAGGLLMALGQFILFACGSLFQTNPEVAALCFYSGLGTVIIGNGFFKPNISSMVGQLYRPGDKRTDAAYTIFYMGINVGAGLGPFVCGYFGETNNIADFKWAFMAAGLGMLLSVIILTLLQNKYIVDPDGNQLGVLPKNEDGNFKKQAPLITVLLGLLAYAAIAIGILYIDVQVFPFLTPLLIFAVLGIGYMIFSDKSLNKIEKEKIAVIFIVSFFVIFFWSAFEQAGASLTFFADEQTNRMVGTYEVPASFFQSLNSIFVIVFAPVFAWVWIKLGQRNAEPASPTKMAAGLMLLSIGYLIIAFGVKDVAPSVKVSMMWLVSMYAFHTFGELCLSPIGLSLVNKLAPVRFASLLMAVWFLANAASNKLAGVLSSFYPDPAKPLPVLMGFEISNLYQFFMLFCIFSAVASLILFSLTKKLQKMMHQ